MSEVDSFVRRDSPSFFIPQNHLTPSSLFLQDGEASRQRCLEPASVNADGGKEEELCSTRTIDVSEKSKGDFRQMEEDVAIVAPAIDGRLKDLARSQ